MKKMLAYACVAVLLGTVMMLGPFALFAGETGTISERDGQVEPLFLTPESLQKSSSETEQMQGIAPASFSPDIVFIVTMFALSFAIASGFMRYAVRKTTTFHAE